MSYDWDQEKKRARLYAYIAVAAAVICSAALFLGKGAGCGSSQPDEPVQPPPPAEQPDCDGLEFGQTIEEACPGSNETREQTCGVNGLTVTRECPGREPPPPPPPPSDCTSYAQVQPVFSRDCGRCHNYHTSEQSAKADINKILQRLKLPSGNPNSMPQGSRMDGKTRGDYVKPFERWKAQGLKHECAEDTSSSTSTGTGTEPPTFVSWEDLEAAAGENARTVALADRKLTRYLYAVNVADTSLYRKAAEKGINSVSLQRAVARAAPVAPGLWRINLRDYGLSARDWEAIEAADVINIESKTAAGETLKVLLSARKPLLGVPQFLDAALANSGAYYSLLRIPRTQDELLLRLGVAFVQDLVDGNANLIGLSYSRLAPHNRLVSRHLASNGFLSFWFTHDTGNLNNDPRKNLVENPFPPEVGSARAFNAVAHEAIFGLPNGLHGYALFNAEGVLQNVAPTDVVQDYHRASVGQEPVIEAGISCFACHNGGLIPRVDEYGDFIKTNPDFNVDDRTRGELLYGDAATNGRLFTEDNAPYAAALAVLEIDPEADDPITSVEDAFVASRDAAGAGRDLVLSEETLIACVKSSAVGDAQCGALARGGQVTQSQWLVCVPALIADCRLFQDRIR